MPELEIWLLTFLVAGLGMGIWAIPWARAHGVWGGRLFVASLLLLGGCSVVAAAFRAEALVPLGLAAGLLVVALLWELPEPSGQES